MKTTRIMKKLSFLILILTYIYNIRNVYWNSIMINLKNFMKTENKLQYIANAYFLFLFSGL
jgi:hypothetical protein